MKYHPQRLLSLLHLGWSTKSKLCNLQWAHTGEAKGSYGVGRWNQAENLFGPWGTSVSFLCSEWFKYAQINCCVWGGTKAAKETSHHSAVKSSLPPVTDTGNSEKGKKKKREMHTDVSCKAHTLVHWNPACLTGFSISSKCFFCFGEISRCNVPEFTCTKLPGEKKKKTVRNYIC